MVNFLVGAVLGFLSGLGVGGGSLLLLWLTFVADIPQPEARTMNLMFFLPCAFVSTVFRRKQCRPDWHLALPAIGTGLVGAVAGNVLGPALNTGLLKKAFGVLFIVCGIRELQYKPK